jgi:hypothetical protein
MSKRSLRDLFDDEEIKLLQEAMERFTRSVGGDLAREKKPSVNTKKKMTKTLELSEKIRTGILEEK